MANKRLLFFIKRQACPRDVAYIYYICGKKGMESIMKEIKTNNAPAAIGPYSQAIVTGGLVFASGQIPVNPETGEIPEGVEAQANQVFTNMKNLLEAAGTNINKVVKTVVFIKNMDDFGTINEIYAKYFTEPFPARSCVEVARLPKDVLLEMEAIAEM
jgi:2-iminobutanoate/2-iminopropanoate deaminase